MEKVSRDVAQVDVEAWLDFKRVSQKKREVQTDSIDALIDAVSDGILTINDETFEITHHLIFPFEGDSPLNELVYKPRLKVKQIHANLSGVKTGDTDGRLAAYVAALTSKNSQIIKNLDTEDYSVGTAIAIFFI